MTTGTPPEENIPIRVRTTQPGDLPKLVEISRRVYPTMPWPPHLLQSHLDVFPQGQLVAIREDTGEPVGMAASLIIFWDDYDINDSWTDFTEHGTFRNHDPEHGRTLYGAEVFVDPLMQGHGVGKKLYVARRELCRRLGLRRIRAGARIPGFHKHADRMSVEEYVKRVIAGDLGDPTLSFQLKQGFRVLAIVKNYVPRDTETQGHAVVIEWINHQVAQPRDYRKRDPQFGKPRKKPTTGV